MKIVAADVLITAPGRNYVTLKVTTDDGLVGLGRRHPQRSRARRRVATCADHVCPLLIGRDAHQIEDTWQYLYKGAYWRRGPVTMTAIAAVDVALWDIKGKAAGLPVYQLLGGAARDGVMVYGHASGGSLDEMLDDFGALPRPRLPRRPRAVRHARAWTASTAFTQGRDCIYEPARGACPPRRAGRQAPTCGSRRRCSAHVRERFGFDVHLLHDVHHRLTPIEAGRLGKDLEEHRLFWMEDATPAEDQEAFRLIRQHTTTPLAVGEVFNTIWDCQQLITERLIDYIRTRCRTRAASRICAGSSRSPNCTACAPVRTVPTDLSPGVLGRRIARRHGRAELRHPGVHGHIASRQTRCSRTNWTFHNGCMHPGDAPGPGRRRRRGGRRAIPVRPEIPSGQPPDRWIGARLVNRFDVVVLGEPLIEISTRGPIAHGVDCASACPATW